MPTPGPVAYQPQPGSLTAGVISTGLLQVAPLSLLLVTSTVREPVDVAGHDLFLIVDAQIRVSSSQITPVSRSTTGAGIANGVLLVIDNDFERAPGAAVVFAAAQHQVDIAGVRAAFFRPSAKASSVPSLATISDGIRNV